MELADTHKPLQTDIQLRGAVNKSALEATVSFTSMASARHAVIKEAHCEMIASEELSTAQTEINIHRSVSLSSVNVTNLDIPLTLGYLQSRPLLSHLDASARDHVPSPPLNNSRSEPLLHDLGENSDRSVESTTSRRSFTRAQSDPGRNTPGIEACDLAFSDDSKSETAASGLEGPPDRPSDEAISALRLNLPSLQSTTGSTGEADHPTPVFAGVERPDAAQLAKQLAEANEQLSRWQTWALNNGIQAVPHYGYIAETAGPIPMQIPQTVSRPTMYDRKGG